MGWRIQIVTTKRGEYAQAVHARRGQKRRTVGLGYLDERQRQRALKALQEGGDRLAGLTNDQVRDWAAHPDQDFIDEFFLALKDWSAYTLREFVEEEFSIARSEDVAEGTWRREQQRLKPLLAGLGDVKLSDLSPLRWERYLRDRGHLAPRTRKLEENLYREVLKHAHFLGAIPSVHAFRRIRGSSKRSWPVVPLSREEVEALLDHAPSKMHRALFGLGVGAGLRPAELMRVHWQDFGWDSGDNGTLMVRGSKTDGSESRIPLTPFARREIGAWYEAAGRPQLGRTFAWGGRAITTYRKALKTAAAASGLDVGGRRIFPNLLRHSFATLAASSGVPLPVAQAILRHTSSKMLLEVYTRVGQEQLVQGLERFPL